MSEMKLSAFANAKRDFPFVIHKHEQFISCKSHLLSREHDHHLIHQEIKLNSFKTLIECSFFDSVIHEPWTKQHTLVSCKLFNNYTYT